MKKTKRSIWILAIGIVLVASVVVLFCTANIRGYSKAQRLYDNGKYSEAYKIYSELGDYRDSAKLAGDAKIRATYCEAEELFKNEDYEKAREMYGQILEYEDAAEKKELSEHLLKVKNDTTAPKISGIKPNEKPIPYNILACFSKPAVYFFANFRYDISKKINRNLQMRESIEHGR